jgi:hypothetical protein
MRKGTNPAKLKDIKVENDCFHQVVVPVYLPKLEGYYIEGLDILKLCLESIYLTVHDKTFITVVNNGSCKEVRDYLDNLMHDGKIQEVIHTTAIGKINAIAKGLAGHHFDLVTITDADVLFTNGWQKEVYDIYETFPKVGMVCTTPQSKRLRYLTENIYFDNLFNSKLKFREVQNPQALKRFAESIGKPQMFKDIHLKRILSLEKNDVKAVLGAGHFSATYKKRFLNKLKKLKYIQQKMGGKVMKKYIDKPLYDAGYWRLSTYKNNTYHIGNSLDPWIKSEFENIQKRKIILKAIPEISHNQKSNFSIIKQKLISKLIFNSYVWRNYLTKLGLSKNEAKEY